MARPFLTATWSNLFLATYPVPPDLLRPRLPPGLDLDTRRGQAFVSLVAFQFIDTRVLGVSLPGWRRFPELNLRYYVRHGDDRGVVFIREFVPSRLVAWVARRVYNEPYKVAPFHSNLRETLGSLTAEYRLQYAGRGHTLEVTGKRPGQRLPESSTEHFFKEHRWGFGISRRGRALRYEVVHPIWETYPVYTFRVDLDWARVYGPDWAFLNGAVPTSTIFAAGSPIAVYPKGKLPPGR
jgi:uncharacterized protein YqjF (DUF2071 family)